MSILCLAGLFLLLLGGVAVAAAAFNKCVKACEEGWVKNGDHCFYWGIEKKNWADAEDFCQMEGGHLASVTSNATRQYVEEGARRRGLGNVWLGGHDIEGEGVWKWTDSTPWEFTFWSRSNPDNHRGNQDCLQYDHDKWKWDDDFCTRQKSFVCSNKIKEICSG